LLENWLMNWCQFSVNKSDLNYCQFLLSFNA
jgi:hypothetical protein